MEKKQKQKVKDDEEYKTLTERQQNLKHEFRKTQKVEQKPSELGHVSSKQVTADKATALAASVNSAATSGETAADVLDKIEQEMWEIQNNLDKF